MAQSPAGLPDLPLVTQKYEQRFFADVLLCQDADKSSKVMSWL